jgi:hypothetical protein
MVSTGLLRLGQRVEDSRGPLKKRETKLNAKNDNLNYALAA